MLDLTTIPLEHLKALIVVCDSFAKHGNRFFADNFVLLSRVALAGHAILEMSEYSSSDLAEACEYFKTAIDDNASLPQDDPAVLFLRYSLTAAHGELQKRARRSTVKAVPKN
jgi:hypothetical protein